MAALSAASIATSLAQVYSVNAVGYVNVTVNEDTANGLTTVLAVANPLNSGANTLAEVIPTAPELTLLFRFNNATHSLEDPELFIGGAWDGAGGSHTFPPGQGGFLNIDNGEIAGSYTFTFVGEVPQGTLTTHLEGGSTTAEIRQIVASKVPQEGRVQTDLGFPPRELDFVASWNRAQWKFNDFALFVGGAWADPEPVAKVAEPFQVVPDPSTPARDWTRTFSVNP